MDYKRIRQRTVSDLFYLLFIIEGKLTGEVFWKLADKLIVVRNGR